ncbi:MAG: hypothetical protein KF729_31375 [Sandaracinaceae bacterium]|nr:hypothetical protein [Sandaracinaceae bacterium]
MKSVGLAGIISLGVHGVVGLAVVHLPAAWFTTRPMVDPISFEIIESDLRAAEAPPDRQIDPEPELPLPPLPPEPHDEPPPQLAAATLEPRPGPPGPPDPTQTSVVDPGPALPVPPDIDVPSVSREEPPRVDLRDRGAMQALLDPSRVARDGFVPTGPGPSQRGPAAGMNGGTGGPDRPSVADIERQHQEHLRGQAMARPWLARTEPQLRRQPDGSLLYDGHRFRARIRQDGSVDFEDHGNASTNGFSASGSFDLTDAIMGAAGQDPHAAERDWFMRRTRDVRHRLEAEHRARETAQALARLRGRLNNVWATTSRTPASRRRRIFQIWEEMADDDAGRRGREVVYAFIREVLPQGGEDAFTDAELTRWNASRASGARFEPY